MLATDPAVLHEAGLSRRKVQTLRTLAGEFVAGRITAIQRAYQMAERPSHDEVLAIAEPWRPYRTLASAYLFASSSAKGTLDRTEP